ncbi:MAG TPA: alpha-glucan family phosphorylase [Gemmatimonadales bacterium]|nr:alpha-glucan family phosphorylase [Gemmatimonadales bacterium]
MTSQTSRIPYLPARIEGLASIAMNLWWSWSREARDLFRAIDELLWHHVRHNPLDFLCRVDPARVAAAASDRDFLRRYDDVVARMTHELTTGDTWFARNYPDSRDGPVAYFCAEFGLHASVPIYSGGLGVLAGDHCKAASDLGLPMVGVGLFYMKGYFDQRLRLDGWQEDSDEEYDITRTPLEPVRGPRHESFLTVVETMGRPVQVRAWRLMVGRVPVYLLDTNLEANHPDDRGLMSNLYGGGRDLRLRQEWILGVGGVRVLRAVGVNPGVWHANEGHAAFMMVERLRESAARGTAFADALREVRATSIFTTHTPVPAGHDAFAVEQVEACAGPVWDEVGISRDQFFSLGQHPALPGQFHMTAAAVRCAARVNGVSRQHGQVSRHLWRELWPSRPWETVPIGHVTNGVHVRTWMAAPVMDLLDERLGRDWMDRSDDPALWDQVLTLDHQRLWDAHVRLKGVLFDYVREDARHRFADQHTEAAQVVGAGTLLDPKALTIGFARRFATYKRANLIFRDLDRLRRLLVNPWRPVQIVFAGKAHPADNPGKEVLQCVYQFTRDPAFEGRVAFLEDYDMHLAHLLVQGTDVWVNLPRLPLEASGTSGMKAALNGVPQLGTLDGWWKEGYDGLAGWAISPAGETEETDAADAERFYRLLEEQVIPLYYSRDARGVPLGWVEKMRYAIRLAGARFTARRMIQEYVQEYYAPAFHADATADDPPTA